MLKSIILVLCSNASGVAQDQEHFDLSNEHLGKIQLGDKIEEVMKEIGPPAESTRQFEDPMNDCIKQLYFYQSGLEVETCKNKRGERVHSLRVVKKAAVKTSLGLSPGSTAEQVMDMYPRHERKGTHSIIVMDRRKHLRLRFLLDNNLVYEISLYRNKPKRSPQITPRNKRRRSLFD